MNSDLTKKLLDAFYTAQQAFTTLPPLSEGMTSQYVHILDAIAAIDNARGSVRVSDVADWFHVSVPGITRSLNALENLGAIRKERGAKDRREVNLVLTGRGRHWYRIYVEEYHERLAEILREIPDEDVRITARTIQSAVRLMHEHPIMLSEIHEHPVIPEETPEHPVTPGQTHEHTTVSGESHGYPVAPGGSSR